MSVNSVSTSLPVKPLYVQEASLFQRINRIYSKAIKSLVSFLEKQGWNTTALTLGTLLGEPWEVIKFGFMRLANLKKQFDFYGLNPEVLTKDQLEKQPILLIHGNHHDQSAWLCLAKKLQDNHVSPVYTVNLPSDEITDKDFEILNQKIHCIKSQYGQKEVKITLIGHSRGGFLAYLVASRQWFKDIKQVIELGSLTPPNLIDFSPFVYEINGEYDVHINASDSLLPQERRALVDTGHVGLLSSAKVHECIVQLVTTQPMVST